MFVVSNKVVRNKLLKDSSSIYQACFKDQVKSISQFLFPPLEREARWSAVLRSLHKNGHMQLFFLRRTTLLNANPRIVWPHNAANTVGAAYFCGAV